MLRARSGKTDRSGKRTSRSYHKAASRSRCAWSTGPAAHSRDTQLYPYDLQVLDAGAVILAGGPTQLSRRSMSDTDVPLRATGGLADRGIGGGSTAGAGFRQHGLNGRLHCTRTYDRNGSRRFIPSTESAYSLRTDFGPFADKRRRRALRYQPSPAQSRYKVRANLMLQLETAQHR